MSRDAYNPGRDPKLEASNLKGLDTSRLGVPDWVELEDGNKPIGLLKAPHAEAIITILFQ